MGKLTQAKLIFNNNLYANDVGLSNSKVVFKTVSQIVGQSSEYLYFL